MTSFGDELCLRFTSYWHSKTPRMLCRSGISPSNEILNLKANIFVDCCSSCSSYCKQPPHACWIHRPTITAMLEIDCSITGFLFYGKTTQYTMVRLHHGIPRNTSVLVHHTIPSCTTVPPCRNTLRSYHGLPWFTMVNHGILYHMVLPWWNHVVIPW